MNIKEFFKALPFAMIGKNRALTARKKDALQKLDRILEVYKAEPVGDGYTEIIVPRNSSSSFLKDVLSEGFRITGITWHEQCDSNSQSKYGWAEYHSRLSSVVFSEIPIGDDDVISHSDIDETYRGIMDIIENKEIRFSDGETLTFKDHPFLTPGFWLDVPFDWKNKYARGDR